MEAVEQQFNQFLDRLLDDELVRLVVKERVRVLLLLVWDYKEGHSWILHPHKSEGTILTNTEGHFKMVYAPTRSLYQPKQQPEEVREIKFKSLDKCIGEDPIH